MGNFASDQLVRFEPLESRRLMHSEAGLSADTFGISMGSALYVDPTGFTWQDINDFKSKSSSGTLQVFQTSSPIANTTLDPLFATTRQDYKLSFAQDLPNGTYKVSLYFAEQRASGEGRTFNVAMENRQVLSNFSIYKTAGALNTAVVKSFDVKVTDGTLDLNLTGGTMRASINAVKVETEGDVTPTPPDDGEGGGEGGGGGGSFNPGKISWTSKASDPIKREEAVSFVSGGKLYAVGGYTDTKYHATTRVDVYNPATNSWSRKKDAPYKVTHAGTAIDTSNGNVWLVGGFIGNFPSPQGTKAVWKYNPGSDSWTKGPDLPESRGSGGAQIVDHKLYYLGGANANRHGDSGKCWVLDLNNTSAGWKSFTSIPKARNHFGYATVNNKIYVFGGQNELEKKGVTLSSGYVYDPANNKWSGIAAMPRPYSHFSFTVGVYKGRYILMAGGENPHNTAKDYVQAYDTVTNKWATLTHLPGTTRAASGGIVGNTYVVSSGWRFTSNQINTTWTADLTKLGLA